MDFLRTVSLVCLSTRCVVCLLLFEKINEKVELDKTEEHPQDYFFIVFVIG
jgi:hypothetical protein